MSARSAAVLRLLYDEANTALWAVAVVFALYSAVVILPRLPQARKRAEFLRVQEIDAENVHYCQKLHMSLGTPTHDECVLVLQQLRNDIERRNADDDTF